MGFFDPDNDGWLDITDVAADTEEAFNEDGREQAGMGRCFW